MLIHKTTKLIASLILSSASLLTFSSLPSKANSIDDANTITTAGYVMALCDKQIAIINQYGNQSPLATQLVVIKCQSAATQLNICISQAVINLSDSTPCYNYFIQLGKEEGWI